MLPRLNQTSLESQTTQSNVNVLTQATPPLRAVVAQDAAEHRCWPSSWARCWRVGAALLLELRDRRVRSADDVVAALGLPVLGVMPKPGAKRFSCGGKRASLMQQRLMAPLPPAAQGRVMAKFSDSAPDSHRRRGRPSRTSRTAAPHVPAPSAAVLDRSIGDIIAELRNLSAEQVEQVLAHQRDNGHALRRSRGGAGPGQQRRRAVRAGAAVPLPLRARRTAQRSTPSWWR